MKKGLWENEVKIILKRKINENPDIFYYIEDPYIEKIIEALIDGVAEVIEENNKKLIRDMQTEIRMRSRL